MKITKEAKIGISSIIILFILYWGINFLKGSNILSATNVFKASYENVGGLEVSSPVIINGMKVGTVTKVDMADIRGNVNVEFTVKREYQVPSNSIVELTGQSLLGGKQLVIKVGDAKSYYKDGDIVVSEIDTGLEDATKEVTTLASQLMDSLTLSLSKFNTLMNDSLINNIHGTIKNLNDATKGINTLIENQKRSIQELLTNLTDISSEVKALMPATNKSMDNISQLTDSLSTSVPQLMGKIDKLITDLNNEEGTLNKLMNDKELYDNAAETLDAARLLLEDLKKNPKRYVNISVFGKKN